MPQDPYKELCQAKNEELAKAMGWHFVENEDFESCTLEWQSSDGTWQPYPFWTVDSEQAFALMAEFNCYPVKTVDPDIVAVATGLDTVPYAMVKISDHPDKVSALRFAIVEAVLQVVLFEKNQFGLAL